MAEAVLYTIGYQGADIDGFIGTLLRARVQWLVDVREAPVSRKADFAKSRLAAHLESAGIGYRHVRALGNPKQGREAARAGELETYRRIFLGHMDGEPAREAVRHVAQLAASERACLLCLERDPRQCHRSIVGDRIAAITGQRIEHLFAETNPAQGKLL